MLLITILVLTVATTVALSLIGRATLDLSMSNQLEESTRAFDAAEAGIESALKSGVSAANVTVATGVTYSVNVNSIGGETGVYQLNHKTTPGTTETVWMVNHDDNTGGLIETPAAYTDNNLTVCWSQPEGSGPKAALVIGILYKEGTDNSYKMARVAADPDEASRNNNFNASVNTGGCGLNYFQTTLTFSPALGMNLSGVSPDTLLALRIRPEYADTNIAVSGATAIPKQGNVIESTGNTGTGVARKVLVYQQYRSAASIFDSVIYSQTNFGHN